METKAERKKATAELPMLQDEGLSCDFNGYDADTLMKETAKLRKLITKRGTLKNFDSVMLYYKSNKIH